MTHLAAIILVVAESVFGVACPLTTLEYFLRRAGGERTYADGCLARWMHPLIFFNFPAWVFMAGYSAFGLMVVAVFYLAPPVGFGAARQKQSLRSGACACRAPVV